MSHTDYVFLKVDASTDLYQSANQFKAVNVDTIAFAIATQSTIKSAISKNCNCQKSIATAIFRFAMISPTSVPARCMYSNPSLLHFVHGLFLWAIKEDVQYVKSIIPLSYLYTYDTCVICAQTQECPSITSDLSKRSFTRFLFATANT